MHTKDIVGALSGACLLVKRFCENLPMSWPSPAFIKLLNASQALIGIVRELGMS